MSHAESTGSEVQPLTFPTYPFREPTTIRYSSTSEQGISKASIRILWKKPLESTLWNREYHSYSPTLTEDLCLRNNLEEPERHSAHRLSIGSSTPPRHALDPAFPVKCPRCTISGVKLWKVGKRSQRKRSHDSPRAPAPGRTRLRIPAWPPEMRVETGRMKRKVATSVTGHLGGTLLIPRSKSACLMRNELCLRKAAFSKAKCWLYLCDWLTSSSASTLSTRSLPRKTRSRAQSSGPRSLQTGWNKSSIERGAVYRGAKKAWRHTCES